MNFNQSQYNGRVNIAGVIPKQQYNMINQPNNGNQLFKTEAIKSIHSGNKLSQVFFSKENINLLQDLIRHTVWERSNRRHTIGRQSDLQLKIIMRSMYFQYGKNLNSNVREQVQRLNKLVVEDSVPRILSGVEQFLQYKKDVSSIQLPMERPKYLSNAGTKTLMPNHWLT